MQVQSLGWEDFPWRRAWHPLQCSCLENPTDGGAWWATYSPWGLEESDTTESLHFHVSLSCIGEGDGNPLPYSRLENPRDRGAWWAAVYGVAQSGTGLKRLSSRSSSSKRLSRRAPNRRARSWGHGCVRSSVGARRQEVSSVLHERMLVLTKKQLQADV